MSITVILRCEPSSALAPLGEPRRIDGHQRQAVHPSRLAPLAPQDDSSDSLRRDDDTARVIALRRSAIFGAVATTGWLRPVAPAALQSALSAASIRVGPVPWPAPVGAHAVDAERRSPSCSPRPRASACTLPRIGLGQVEGLERGGAEGNSTANSSPPRRASAIAGAALPHPRCRSRSRPAPGRRPGVHWSASL